MALPRAAHRDLAIDAMRGASMLFVVVSHFGFQLAESWSGVPWQVGDRLTIIGMVASPAFLLVSGLTMATLAEEGARFERLRGKLIDRGLFTLVAGHVILGLADGTLRDGPLRQNLAITDVVGLATVLAAAGLVRWSLRRCFATAALLLATAWIGYALVAPTDRAAAWLVGVLVGSHSDEVAVRGFPLLPWLAVYLVGLGLGHRRRHWTPPSAIPAHLARLAAVAVGLAAALWLGRRALLQDTGWPPLGSPAYRLLSPLDKYPPGPVYLLAFGGAALAMFAAVEWLTWATRSRVPAWLAPIGRASLLTFIAQAVLIQQVLPALAPDLRGTWPLWLLLILATLYGLAWWWQRHDLNRLFTLGLARHWPPRPSSAITT